MLVHIFYLSCLFFRSVKILASMCLLSMLIIGMRVDRMGMGMGMGYGVGMARCSLV